jgi:phospholipid/cholesterol/gamma-HCH transport system substrate-binding protein
VILANVDVIKNNLDTIIRSLKNIIQDGSLQSSLQNINSTTINGFYCYSGQIENILADIKNFTNTIKSNDSEFDSIIKNVNQFSGTLKNADIPKTLEDLSGRLKQLENILTKIENGEGTLGKLNTNDTLYQNLQHSIGNLDELIKDIKANPKRYLNVTVFGGKKK